MMRVVTKHPIAIDSNDHKYPYGTANDDYYYPGFNDTVQELFGHPCSVLDLGCSGGGMVHSFLCQGHLAVGIEGSDYSQKRKRAQWEYLDGTHLFTADITKPFTVSEEHVNQLTVCYKFDVITLWEVIEHIAESDLKPLFHNINRHLKPNGIVVMSVSPNHDWVNGYESGKGLDYHQCVHDEQWWTDAMAKLRWFNNKALVRRFGRNMVRGWENAPDSFHMVLERG